MRYHQQNVCLESLVRRGQRLRLLCRTAEGKSKKNEKYVANPRMNLLGAFRLRKSLPCTRNGAKH